MFPFPINAKLTLTMESVLLASEDMILKTGNAFFQNQIMLSLLIQDVPLGIGKIKSA